jgi:hypothetical protein
MTRFEIVHEITHDRASADDQRGADLAVRTLRDEGQDHFGCSPRYRPIMVASRACRVCGGDGWLPSLPEGESTCPYCDGSGKEGSS